MLILHFSDVSSQLIGKLLVTFAIVNSAIVWIELTVNSPGFVRETDLIGNFIWVA